MNSGYYKPITYFLDNRTWFKHYNFINHIPYDEDTFITVRGPVCYLKRKRLRRHTFFLYTLPSLLFQRTYKKKTKTASE